MKPKHHREVQESRQACCPKVGAKVLYPIPQPPVSLVKLGDSEPLPQFLESDEPTLETPLNPDWEKAPWSEIAVPTGDETWLPGKVVQVDHHWYGELVGPDQYIAILETDDGLISVPVVFLREPQDGRN